VCRGRRGTSRVSPSTVIAEEADPISTDTTTQAAATTDAGLLARQLVGALPAIPDAELLVLQEAVRAELARRDVLALVAALRAHLSADSRDPEIRELVALHGGARSVLFVAEEWDTGHQLGPDADVTFEDGDTENVDLRRLQPYILEVSAVHAPVGYAAEYRVDLRTGDGVFAPIGFGDPVFPPGVRPRQPE